MADPKSARPITRSSRYNDDPLTVATKRSLAAGVIIGQRGLPTVTAQSVLPFSASIACNVPRVGLHVQRRRRDVSCRQLRLQAAGFQQDHLLFGQPLGLLAAQSPPTGIDVVLAIAD